MNDDLFIDDLSLKFNYDIRTVNALKKIVPSLVSYYGSRYYNVIKLALFDCEIIHCNSYQTISMILDNLGYNSFDLNIKNLDGIYISKPNISYNIINNCFNLDSVRRKIIISHTFNFDSPKGLEVLTSQICNLIKSYNYEYRIEDNYLFRNNGLYSEKNKINIDEEGNISFSNIKKFNEALELGLNIFDTDKIVSIILNDDYKSYNYESIFTVAMILKDKFNFKDLFNEEEFMKNNIIDYSDNNFINLSNLIDECYLIEDEMTMYSYTREKKDELKQKLSNLLCNDIYNCLINFMIKNKKRV